MNHAVVNTGGVLRFRRWSRRAWSVFASLGQRVTIGVLRAGMAEQSQEKMPPAGNMNRGARLEKDSPEEDELLEIELPEVVVFADITPVPAGEKTGLISGIKNINSAVGTVCVVSTAFYLY